MPFTLCDRLNARIARARLLAAEYSAASEMLTFYAELAEFQKKAGSLGGWETGRLEAGKIVSAVPGFLSFLADAAPSRLADAAKRMHDVDIGEWQSIVERYWSADAHDIPDVDETMIFVIEALLQPVAEAAAMAHPTEHRGTDGAPGGARRGARCPACSGKPVVCVLRDEGQSARRSLVCGLCLTEWPWPRIVCPSCGEDVFDALPIYRSEAFPNARVDACDSCRTYLKTVDLSKDALAIPVVDELASIPLDLWAREHGYTKLRPNILRV